MSKLLTVTIPNPLSDSLDRYMRSINVNLPSGLRISKSNFVADCVKAGLEKENVPIVADTVITEPLPPIVYKPKLPPL